MTDTNELRRMLDELADETPELPAQEWITGTRHKVRVRRRARWAGAGVVALVLAAAATVVPQVVNSTGPEPIAPVSPPDGREGRSWDFPAGTDTTLIIASRLNEPGSSELEWRARITEPPAFASSMQFCHLPRGTTPNLAGIRAVSYVDGRRLLSSTCRPWRYPPVDNEMASSSLMPLPGVERKKPFTVTMRLERDGEGVDVPGAEFGFALYWCDDLARLERYGAGACSVPTMPRARPTD
jgi:hypothetical protein